MVASLGPDLANGHACHQVTRVLVDGVRSAASVATGQAQLATSLTAFRSRFDNLTISCGSPRSPGSRIPVASCCQAGDRSEHTETGAGEDQLARDRPRWQYVST